MNESQTDPNLLLAGILVMILIISGIDLIVRLDKLPDCMGVG